MKLLVKLARRLGCRAVKNTYSSCGLVGREYMDI